MNDDELIFLLNDQFRFIVQLPTLRHKIYYVEVVCLSAAVCYFFRPSYYTMEKWENNYHQINQNSFFPSTGAVRVTAKKPRTTRCIFSMQWRLISSWDAIGKERLWILLWKIRMMRQLCHCIRRPGFIFVHTFFCAEAKYSLFLWLSDSSINAQFCQ